MCNNNTITQVTPVKPAQAREINVRLEDIQNLEDIPRDLTPQQILSLFDTPKFWRIRQHIASGTWRTYVWRILLNDRKEELASLIRRNRLNPRRIYKEVVR